MKKVVFVATLPILLFLFGCPVGVDFAPGNEGKEKIDNDLIGTWETKVEDPEFAEAAIGKKDDYTLHASLSKTGTTFTLDEKEVLVWNTEVDGQKILYAKSGGQYFTYGYKIVSEGLVLYDISLLVNGIDAVTSTETYRKEISVSLKKPGCLKEEKLFIKKK